MLLGKPPVPGRSTILITVGQGPIALAGRAGGEVWTFLSQLSVLLFLPLFGGWSGIAIVLVHFKCRGVLRFGSQ